MTLQVHRIQMKTRCWGLISRIFPLVPILFCGWITHAEVTDIDRRLIRLTNGVTGGIVSLLESRNSMALMSAQTLLRDPWHGLSWADPPQPESIPRQTVLLQMHLYLKLQASPEWKRIHPKERWYFYRLFLMQKTISPLLENIIADILLKAGGLENLALVDSFVGSTENGRSYVTVSHEDYRELNAKIATERYSAITNIFSRLPETEKTLSRREAVQAVDMQLDMIRDWPRYIKTLTNDTSVEVSRLLARFFANPMRKPLLDSIEEDEYLRRRLQFYSVTRLHFFGVKESCGSGLGVEPASE